MRSQLVSPLEAEAGAARALEIRRAASHAGEIPGAWMLDSPGLSDVVNTARRLATVPGLPMLIEGERGTGVPELARMVHDEDPVARLRHFWMVPSCQVGQPELRRESLVDGTLFIEDIESLRPAAQEWVAELLAARMQSKEQSLRRQIAEKQSQRESTSKKIGRNDPCPCGSGKKFKKCCIKKQDLLD